MNEWKNLRKEEGLSTNLLSPGHRKASDADASAVTIMLAKSQPTQTLDSCNDAWGARIKETLLIDLSQEERQSLAEHIQTCSACAALVRKYQLIEGFAGKISEYNNLVVRKPKRRRRRKGRSYSTTGARSYPLNRSKTKQRLLAAFVAVFTISALVWVMLPYIAGALFERGRIFIFGVTDIITLLLGFSLYGGVSKRLNRLKGPSNR